MKTVDSVCMCVRNVEKHIGNCIRSILDQTFTDFEIMVIDEYDSRNKTKNREFRRQTNTIFQNEKWLGVPMSRNLSEIRNRRLHLLY